MSNISIKEKQNMKQKNYYYNGFGSYNGRCASFLSQSKDYIMNLNNVVIGYERCWLDTTWFYVIITGQLCIAVVLLAELITQTSLQTFSLDSNGGEPRAPLLGDLLVLSSIQERLLCSHMPNKHIFGVNSSLLWNNCQVWMFCDCEI